MAQDVTVTLTNTQVAKGLEYARLANPDTSNEELRDMLEHAAYYGPGIREKIAEWERIATRQQQNELAASAVSEFEETFPPAPAEEDEVIVDE